MKVAEIMSSDVKTCSPQDSLKCGSPDRVGKLTVGCSPVVNDNLVVSIRIYVLRAYT